MRSRSWVVTALLLLGGLLMAFLGQACFFCRPPYAREGAILYAAAIALWGAASWRAIGIGCPLRARRSLRHVFAHPIRWVFHSASVALVVGAGMSAVRAGEGDDFTVCTVSWVMGLLFFLAALSPRPTRDGWREMIERIAAGRVEVIGLAILLLVALAVRGVALEDIPANFGGDEGTQALAALQLVEPPLDNPFSTGWYSVPTGSLLAYGLSMRLFGATVAGARALSAFVGAATVLATFLLARELAGRQVAWVAAVLVTFGHYGIHFSRLASNQSADGLLTALALYLLLRGMKDPVAPSGSLWMGLAGVVLGLSWYGYFGARLATVVVLLYIAWRAYREPRLLARHGSGLAYLAAGVLVAVSPLIFYYMAHPGTFVARHGSVSILASGWLEREVALTGRSAGALLAEQLLKAVSAFNYTPDPSYWYHPGIPLLDPITGVFFVLGLTLVTVRARRPASGLLLIWFWSLVLLAWALTENPPSSQRGVGSVPVVAILAALGLVGVTAFVQRGLRGDRGGRRCGRRWLFALASVLLLIAAANLTFYFAVYSPQRVYGNPIAEIADVLCDLLQERETIPPIYFDGSPHMYWDFGAIAFRLRDVPGQDFSPGEDLADMDLSQGALFVVLPGSISDIARVQRAFPGGDLEYVASEVDGRLLFALYQVSLWRNP